MSLERRFSVQDKAALGALLRLKRLEITKSPAVTAAIVGAVAFWCVLGAAAGVVGAGSLDELLHTDGYAKMCALISLVFVLAPLLAGGGAETATAKQLARFPIGAKVLYCATWLQTLIDVQFIVTGPFIFGLGAAKGVVGAFAALLFLFAISLAGTLAGYIAMVFAAGRKKMLAAFVGIVALAVALSYVTGTSVGAVAMFGGAVASAGRDGKLWALAMLVAAALGAAAAGPFIVNAARRADDNLRAGVHHASFRPGSGISALIRVNIRSTQRPVATRLGLASALGLPLLAAASGEAITASGLAGTIIVALSVTLCVNGFSFSGGGMLWQAAAPISKHRILVARFLASSVVVGTAGGFIVALVAMFSAVGRPWWQVAGVVACDSLVCSAFGTFFSVTKPTPVDYSTIRVRPAGVTVVLTMLACCAVAAGLVATSWAYTPVAGVCSTALLVAGVMQATWRRYDLERLALAVR